MRNAFCKSGITFNDESSPATGAVHAMRRAVVLDALNIHGPFRLATFACGMVLALSCTLSPRLAIAQQSTPQAQSDDAGAVMSDTALTAKAKAKLVDTPDLDTSNIHVTTTNGVITLTGMADTSDAKSGAEDAVKSIDGVKSVQNDLTIATNGTSSADGQGAVDKTEHVATDSWITTKVKSELLADSVSKGVDVGVETTHGVVVLSGKLATSDAIAHVKHIAQSVQGVKSVDTSALTVGTP